MFYSLLRFDLSSDETQGAQRIAKFSSRPDTPIEAIETINKCTHLLFVQIGTFAFKIL